MYAWCDGRLILSGRDKRTREMCEGGMRRCVSEDNEIIQTISVLWKFKLLLKTQVMTAEEEEDPSHVGTHLTVLSSVLAFPFHKRVFLKRRREEKSKCKQNKLTISIFNS